MKVMERTLVRLMVQYVSAEQAEAIRRNLDAIEWAEEVWDWIHDEESQRLFADAKMASDPGAELFWIATHVWGAAEEFCDVYLLVNPCEAGHKVYVADEDEYEEYQKMRKELGLEP